MASRKDLADLGELEAGEAALRAPLVAIGLDIGAVTIKAVALGPDRRVTATRYRRHHGEIGECIRSVLAELAPGSVDVAVAVSGIVPPGLTLEAARVDTVQATLRSVRAHSPGVQNVLDLGGASVSAIRLDARGDLVGLSRNSLCAAGTGAFLDEQAQRLGLTQEVLDQFDGVDDPPSVASRCAVFAKSDLIHRQQEGHSREAMWTGLCKGMTSMFFGTLLKGRVPDGETVVVGGVSRNRIVLRALRGLVGSSIRTFGTAHLAAAEGAALLAVEKTAARRNGDRRAPPLTPVACASCTAEDPPALPTARRPALELHKTRYPDFSVHAEWCHRTADSAEEAEVRLHRDLTGTPSLDVYLGIDVGSTSTKAALVDSAGQIVFDVYRKTAGDPIGATRGLLDAIADASERTGCAFAFLGVGTTGSGRTLVGQVIGADRVLNEITAHVTGAMSVETQRLGAKGGAVWAV